MTLLSALAVISLPAPLAIATTILASAGIAWLCNALLPAPNELAPWQLQALGVTAVLLSLLVGAGTFIAATRLLAYFLPLP